MTRTGKMIAILAALTLTVALCAPALALGAIDLTREGFVTLTTADDEFRADFERQASEYGQSAAVNVLVYKMADVNENGAFTLTEPFAPLAEEHPELWNGGVISDGLVNVQALMEAAVAMVFPEQSGEDPEQPDDPLYEPEPAFEPTFEQTIDPLGDTLALAEHGQSLGLYLLLPRKMQTVQWVYTFSPLLVAVPSIERDTTPDDGGLPSEGEWRYDVPAQMKGTRERRLTEIVIVKTLREYNQSLGETTFLFDVEAEIGGVNVFSQLVPLTFSGAGTQSVTVSGIPVGAHVTVTEVYSGASYEVVDGQVDIPWLPLPDESNGMNRVPFTNTYTDRQNPDVSLVNTWVRQGEGWVWQG